MKLKSYAQHGEDDIIWKFFNKKNNGLIIEVGAFDGKYLSNSYALEKLGWKSVCIEPLPSYYKLLCKNRPDSININAAIVATEEIGHIEINEDLFGVYSSIETIDENLLKNAFKNGSISYEKPRKTRVKAITLNKVLKENNITRELIDCLSIDVEGFELDVLKSTNLSTYSPKLIIVEANNNDKLKPLQSYLNRKGYHLARKNNVNYFFVNDENKIEALQSISIDCKANIFKHPKGLLYSEQSPYLDKVRLFLVRVIKKIFKIKKSLNSRT